MKGSVYKRPNGTWEYRFELSKDPLTGKRRQTSKGGFRTQREASAAMRKAMAAHDTGRHVAPSRRTVASFLDEWHAARKAALKPTTWAKYRYLKDHYVTPVIGETALQDLSPVRLNLLYAHLLEHGRVRPKQGQSAGLKPSSVAAVHRMLHRALNDAVKWGYLPRNVAEDAEPPKAGRAQHNIWTPEQLRAFVQHVQGDWLYALWLLVVTTGLRRSEMAGLRPQDVDLKASIVWPFKPRVVVDGKAADSDGKSDDSVRPVALDPMTLAAIKARVEQWEKQRADFGHDQDRLFCWPDGRSIHPDTITDWFQQHARAAGLPVIRLHDVRHSYATACIRAGVHPRVLSARLGHADVAFTMRVYGHLIPGMDQDAANTVAALILGTPDGSGPGQASRSAGGSGTAEPSPTPLTSGSVETGARKSARIAAPEQHKAPALEGREG